VIRRVRNLQQATNIVPLLDALEANGWPSRMQSPFGPDFTAHRLHATVQSLNENLTRIRFRADGLSMEVRWSRVADGDDESIGTQ
jgi:hypothetical protein